MRMVLWPNVSVYKHSVFFSNHFISVMVVVDLGAVELIQSTNRQVFRVWEETKEPT